MKRYLAAIGLLCAAGCANFSNNVERTTETTTHLAFAGYVGWTNAVNQYPQLAVHSNAVHELRMKFVASVKLVDQLNASYQTNGVDKATVQGALDTVLSCSSNLLWTINFLEAK